MLQTSATAPPELSPWGNFTATAQTVVEDQEVDTLSISPLEAALVWLDLLGVRVEMPARVRSMLSRRKELLIPVISATQETIAANPRLSLTLVVKDDPEVPEEWLTLIVRADRYDDDSTVAIVDGADEKVQEHLPPGSGIFHVATDFRPAR